jgi:hypothetical protein
MDYGILRTELALPAYTGLTDAQAADELNAPLAIRQRVPLGTLQATAMESGVYTQLLVAVGTPETPIQLKALCQTVLNLVDARFDDVDLDNAQSRTIWTALQTAGVITTAQATAILALGDTTTTRAAQLGLEHVEPGHVGRVRAGGG